MKVWLLDYHPANNTIEFSDYDDYTKVNNLLESRNPIICEWSTCKVQLNEKNKPADILERFNGALVISRKVKDIFEQNNLENVEFLPLSSSTEVQYFIFRVLTIIDCIDPLNSKVTSYDSNNIASYDEYCLSLVKETLQDQHIFRIKLPQKDVLLPYIYISDELKELLDRSIVGCQLVEIWDSELSWKEKEEKYETICNEVDKSLLKTFDFGKARKYVLKNKGKLAYSGKWAIKADENNRIWLGDLLLDGSYSWMIPVYYPPILLGLKWGVFERQKSIFSRLKNRIPFR